MFEMLAYVRARVGEQHLRHERDGGRGAFDIEEDRAGSHRRRHWRVVPRTGRSAGPKQTGWNPASTPLSV